MLEDPWIKESFRIKDSVCDNSEQLKYCYEETHLHMAWKLDLPLAVNDL